MLIGVINPAFANNPEWQWKVVGHSPTFDTKAQAAAYIRTLPDQYNRYEKLTIEKKVAQLSDSSEFYEYEAPKVGPIVGSWSYQNATSGGPFFPSEAELVSYVLGSGTQSSPGCPAKTLTPNDDWHLVPNYAGWGGNNSLQRRFYTSRYYHTAACNEMSSTLQFRRSRSVTCPPGYFGEYPAPGCYIPLTKRVQGTLLYFEPGCRGNPCNAITGDKHETVIDYEGADGLRFERHYHSRSLDATNQLGVGWTHNYRMRIIADSSGILWGLVRPNGYRESLRSITSSPVPTYVSVSGTGIVAKKTTSTLWQVFNPDGSVESYDDDGLLHSIFDRQGGVTTLEYDGGNLVLVRSPFGHALGFDYDSDGRLTEVTTGVSEILCLSS